ncbi:hypothetical protein KIN20_033026 [Parelaphostrongylus tenuis]|uniref:Uncharacterized protein n=1 Tax=Parelaphostrongylus tenuis TaxID=148309 RepID=A0AAD5R7F4_PARTN|nr:hypothetical protein KIN20_033026 [Parelaphostrongylus tenuis]
MSEIVVLNMAAEVKMKQSDPRDNGCQKVTESITNDKDPSPCVDIAPVDGECIDTTKRMREQLKRLTQQQQKVIDETFKTLDSDPVKNGLRTLLK